MRRSIDEIRPGYRFNESCQETVPQALTCVLEVDGFEDALRNAISIGGDSNTIGAIAGGVAEALFGIPDDIAEQGWRYLPQEMHEVMTGLYRRIGKRRRIVIDHHNRSRNETIRREVSPQRLNYYRENWYLDAWCYLRDELRSFGLDAIKGAWLGTDPAHEVAEEDLAAVLDAGYGIFGGKRLNGPSWSSLRRLRTGSPRRPGSRSNRLISPPMAAIGYASRPAIPRNS